MQRKTYLCVVDSSIVQSWLFAEYASEHTDKVLEYMRVQPIIVPANFHGEVAQLLCNSLVEGKFSEIELRQRQNILASLPIHTDPIAPAKMVAEAIEIALKTELSIAQSCYLALAQREETPLVTRDSKLAEVARNLGVTVLP